jgi:hypothetical protein
LKTVMAPTQRLKEVDGTFGNRYYQQPDGSFNVTDHDAKKLVAYGGFLKPTMGCGGSDVGYRCTVCGFGSWFKHCSRCDADTCEREESRRHAV